MFGSGGGGFGASSGTGFGTSTPFGSSTTTQQGSAFGTGGSTFGSSTTPAFGAKPTFGSTSTSGFGGAFGAAKPTSVFGAPAPAAGTSAFGGGAAAGTSAFGRTTSTSPFGAPAPAASTAGAFGSTTTSAFGAPAPASSPFGAPAPAVGGFGASAGAANPFGKPASSPFGAPAPAAGGVFGAAPAPATTGFGGFGTPTSTAAASSGGLFGAPAPAPATGAFGAPAPAPAGGAFGGFGTTGGAFGASPAQQQQGTGNPSWKQTRAEDPTGKAGANPGMLMSISAMKEYSGKSHEELRVEDYLQNRKNSSAVSGSQSFTGFGGISLGGAPAPAPGGLFGGFGAAPTPAPTPTSGFSFGAAAPAPAASPFGGFGATTPAPAPATGGFAGFGAAPAPASGGLFGAPAPAPAAGGAFGATQGGFSFGSTPAPAPATTGTFGTFGASAPQPAPAAGGGLFGAAPAPALSFGSTATAPAPAPTPFGTSSFGFGATPAPAAPAPSAFSFGQTPAAAPATGAFGAPAPAASTGLFGSSTGGGLFGSTPAPAPATGAGAFSFGAKTAAPAPGTGFSFGGTSGAFGAAATKPAIGFGAPAPAAGGLFGAPAPAPSAVSFGSTPAPAAGSTSTFGGFGAGFGTSAPAPTSPFAAPAPAGGGLFGAAPGAAGGLFGSTTQQQQQQQQRVAMHNQDPYGASGNPGFGSGALEQKVKGVQNSSQQLAISFERGSGANPSGANAADQGGGVGTGVGGGGGVSTGASVGNAAPSVGFAYRRTPRSSARIRPRGLTGGGENVGAGGDGGNSSMLPPSSSRLLSEGSLTPGVAGGVAGSKARGILSPDVYLSAGVKRLNIPVSNTEERRPRFSESRPLIKPDSGGDGGTTSAQSGDGGVSVGGGGGGGGDRSDNSAAVAGGAGGGREETKTGERDDFAVTTGTSTPAPSANRGGGGAGSRNGGAAGIGADSGVMGGALADMASPPPSGAVGTDVRAAAGGRGGDESLLDDGSPSGGGSGGGGGGLFDVVSDADIGVSRASALAPTLNVVGYETIPRMSELAAMDESSLRSVTGFKVSRHGFGSIAWKEPVDLRGVDIGAVVAIESKSASVYDDLPEGEEKPPRGEGLNKPTTVTLLGIFPKGDDPSDEQKRRYEQKVRRNTEKLGAALVDYSATTGIWVFDTLHWSRYAMDDDSDDDDGAGANKAKAAGGGTAAASKLMPPPPPLGAAGRMNRPPASSTRGQRPPRRSTKYAMPDTDDEGSIADNASDAGGGSVGVGVTAGGGGNSSQAGHGDEDADMADAGYAHPAGVASVTFAGTGGSQRGSWVDPRLPTNKLFHSPMDTEQVGSMRETFERGHFGSRGVAGGVGGSKNARESGGGDDLVRPGDAASGTHPRTIQRSPWEPLEEPRVSPSAASLADPEDEKAAAAFRPAVRAADSRVLRLLADAWNAEGGEKSDNGVRGQVRAGALVADLGLRVGRGFRASWGPGGTLVYPGTVGGGASRRGRGDHTVKVLKFDPTPSASPRGAEELYVETLCNHQQFAEQINSSPTFGAPGAVAGSDENSPPRWALPHRRHDRPENYDALVRCMHGYAAAHRAIASKRTGGAGGGMDGLASSPEWVLEQMWCLASAMWGQEEGDGKGQDLPMPGEAPLHSDIDGNNGDYAGGPSPSCRREAAVADWLANAVSICVPPVPKGDDPWRKVLELLSVRRVGDAARLAVQSGLPRLAVVLAASATASGQTGGACHGTLCPSSALAKQVELWQAGGADARMPQEAFAIYQLLGRERFRDMQLRGVIGGGKLVAGGGQAASRHRSLDWLRQLGLCLWFGAGVSSRDSVDGAGGSGVAEALEAFESLVADKEALEPTARYVHEATHHAEENLEEVCTKLRAFHVSSQERSGRRDRCILNRLLALYPPRHVCAGGVGGASASVAAGSALLAALEPLAVCPDVMDYRHSWHLMTVVEALGVAVISDRCTAAAVAEGLRFQLIVAGLWEWAVYVTLSTSAADSGEGGDAADRRRSEATAHELVVRYGHGLLAARPDTADGKRRRLLDTMGVPEAWLYEAAAVRAGYEHKSALPAPTTPCMPCNKKSGLAGTDGSVGGNGVEAELNRGAKLGLLVSAGSARLAGDAAKELCRLAPTTLYLGREVEELTKNFHDISEKLGVVEERDRNGIAFTAAKGGRGGGNNRMIASGVDTGNRVGGGGGRTKEFDAYNEMLFTVQSGPIDGEAWTSEEIERLRRMRDVVECAAARVAGEAVAHEALSTLWRKADLIAAE